MNFSFAHNNLNVLDLDRSLAFYREALGLDVARTKEASDGSFRLAFLSDGNTNHRLELTWLRDRTVPYNLGDNEIHLAFETADMDAAHALHEKMGCICYENPGMGIYFISDPDGYWIEIVPAKGQAVGAQSIFHRTSIRKYQPRAVEPEKVERILRAGMAAPSVTNQQPWEFYVLHNRSLIEQVSGCTPFTGCAKDAPVVIVPCYRKDIRLPAFAQIDMSICCENMLLEADAQGLGAVWLGVAPMEQRMAHLAQLIHAEEGLAPFAILPCGYPAEEKRQEDRYDPARIHHLD